MYVKCYCDEERHSPDEVEITNIEEDFQGRDVVTFFCPFYDVAEHGLNEVKSFVFGR